MRNGERPGGFTLLEVMLALGVLAVALVALLGLRNRDLSMQAHARHLVTATALAKLKLEELIVVPDVRDGEPAGEFGERYPGFRWTRTIAPAPLIDWLEYRVEVSWAEGARQERVELMTYVKDESASL